jgi:CubicO group peptidase (beta-lactamase class C family)
MRTTIRFLGPQLPRAGAAPVALGAAILLSCAPVRPVEVTRAGPPWIAGSVDAEMERLMIAAHVPGLALALIDDGNVVYEKAYGLADRDTGAPLRTDTVMYAASLTKAAFAHLVLQLVDDGVLGLDDPLPRLLKKPLPEYPDYADLRADPRWQRLTPRMLLAHASGLVNWRWINEDKKLDFKFDPGTRYAYSGEGIQILQLVVEERTGRSVSDLMKERVFDRFDMRHTSLVWRPEFESHAATEYDAGGKRVEHVRHDQARAAGSMDTTVDDYARFLAGVLRGEGLSPALAQAMLSPQIAIVSPQEFPAQWPGETDVYRPIGLSYGLGWGVFRSLLGPAFFKEGHSDSTNNVVLGFRAHRSGIVMLSNSGNGERMFYPAITALFGQTCLPWFWMGYIPYTRPDLMAPEARAHPEPACSE